MAAAAKLAELHMRRQVSDPELREKITPNYALDCKRMLLSNDYLPTLQRDNVDVVTDKIIEVRPHAVVAAGASGNRTEHEVDTIIAGTGFAIADLPISHRVHGADGRRLAEHWDGTVFAHNGTLIHGFPNLFTLLGPNTGIGHGSAVFMIESQINLVMDTLRHMVEHDLGTVEPTRAAQDAFVAEMRRRTRGTVWVDGGCSSYYLDTHGIVHGGVYTTAVESACRIGASLAVAGHGQCAVELATTPTSCAPTARGASSWSQSRSTKAQASSCGSDDHTRRRKDRRARPAAPTERRQLGSPRTASATPTAKELIR